MNQRLLRVEEKTDRLNAGQIWPSAGSLLQMALSKLESANAGPLPQSLGIGQSRLSAKANTNLAKAQDVVPYRESLGEAMGMLATLMRGIIYPMYAGMNRVSEYRVECSTYKPN